MSLGHYQPKLTRQPIRPSINWSDPITEGLVGLIWGGPGGARDLVYQPYSLIPTEITIGPGAAGMASRKPTFAYGGWATARLGYGQWALANAPLTLAVFADYVTPGTSRWLGGVYCGTGGYSVGVKYSGLRYNAAAITIGGVNRSVEAAAASTGPCVYAMTATSTRLAGYDKGKLYQATTYTGTAAITYDATLARLIFGGHGDSVGPLGDYYWQALWARELTAAENLRLAQEPWCLFVPKRIWVPQASASGIPVLSAPSYANLTATTVTPRVTITF